MLLKPPLQVKVVVAVKRLPLLKERKINVLFVEKLLKKIKEYRWNAKEKRLRYVAKVVRPHLKRVVKKEMKNAVRKQNIIITKKTRIL